MKIRRYVWVGLLGVSNSLVSSSAVSHAADQYQVEHDWTVSVDPEWTFEPIHIGLGTGSSGSSISLDLADSQWKFFRARLLSTWLSVQNGEDAFATSILPVGVSLPPYKSDRFKPYYLFHWSMLGHELGVETTPGYESNLGFRLAGVYSPDFSAVTVAAAVGGVSDSIYSSYDDYYGFRFGIGSIGASFGAGQESGVRGTLLDFHFGAFNVSLLEYDIGVDSSEAYMASLLPVGLSMPPELDIWLRPFYKFHWTPIVQQLSEGNTQLEKLVGQHTIGVGILVPDGGSVPAVIKIGLTSGVDLAGRSSTRLGVELESTYLFAILL